MKKTERSASDDGTLLLDGLILTGVDARSIRKDGDCLYVKLSGRSLEYLIDCLYPFFLNRYNGQSGGHELRTARLELVSGAPSPDATERHREWGHLVRLTRHRELWSTLKNATIFQREDEEMYVTVPLLILDADRDDGFSFCPLGRMGLNCAIRG